MCWKQASRRRGRPCVLLLHGFPELAYSWRKVMPALAEAGYHVIAPDQRGYGRTTGWDADYDGDLSSFRLLNLVRDALGLVSAFGYASVDAVVGHDFGSSVAAWCALVRPDVFRSVALMSAPFAGPPPLPFDTADAPPRRSAKIPCIANSRRCRVRASIINGTTRRARPMPTCTTRRKACMISCAPITITRARTGKTTSPIRCKSWSAGELAKLPTYYVMDLAKNMAETVAAEMPSAQAIAANRWLPDRELACLQRRICPHRIPGRAAMVSLRHLGRVHSPNSQTWSGRSIDVPSCFIAGKQDWGTYQRPGVFEAMQTTACTQHDRLSSDRRRRPLGAAGAARPRSAGCCCNSCEHSRDDSRLSR